MDQAKEIMSPKAGNGCYVGPSLRIMIAPAGCTLGTSPQMVETLHREKQIKRLEKIINSVRMPS